MIISRLRNKLLVGAIAISIVVALASMLAVSWVISQQYLEQSNVLLHKASRVIEDNLADRKSNLLVASRQLATQKNLGSTLWYLAQYASSNVSRETLFNTYQQLAKNTYEIGRVAKLSRMAIYDPAGKLISFSLFEGGKETVGFVERHSKPVFRLATLKENEELGRQSMHPVDSFFNISAEFDELLPQQESVHYVVADGMLAIESDVPVMGEAFDPVSGKQEIKQLGLVVAVQLLDQAFVDRLSRLTDIQINIFTPQGLVLGDLPAYRNLKWDKVQAGAQTSFNEIEVAGDGYYQGLVQLYAGRQLIGSIAALHSKGIVRKNTWEMVRTLSLIAAASLLLIFPFAWYFANSISRPLTLLSRIFRGVAGGQNTGALSAERNYLEKEKTRQDELGDLTQSFIAMDDAVNQKIQQINEMNASLEQKVKERTAKLSAREQESRTLIENSPDTIARYDRECRRIYVNPAFGAMTAGGIEALTGKKPSEVPGGANSVIYEEKIKEVFETGIDTQFELKWPGINGKEFCTHIRLTPERDLSGAVTSVLGVGRDITQLNEYRNEIEQKELAKSRFLAAAGHDLRQPLAAANLFIDALKFAAPTPKQDAIIHRLDQSMTTFNSLLDALLNVSKLDAGAIKPEYTATHVAEIFNWIEQNCAPLAMDKKLGFRLYFPMREPLVVHSDIGLIKSVLMNLVSNAIKYTSQGAILVSARRRGKEVLFQVWDTGMGIPKEHVPRIFDEFYQIDNPQRDRTHGLGLGLSIVKRALALLGAEIACRSQSGHGTVFEFRLPLDEALGVTNPQDRIMPLDKDLFSSFAQGKRFVVVEDDALVGQAMINLLEGVGGEVLLFHTAEEALRHSNIEHADYVVSDYMLGGNLNGIQFLNEIRDRFGKPINAVLMTGDTSSSFLVESTDCAWTVLHKPINLSELFSSLGA